MNMRKIKIGDNTYECDDYRQRIESFTPSILKIIPENSRYDIKIQKSFLSRLIDIEKQIKEIIATNKYPILKTFLCPILSVNLENLYSVNIKGTAIANKK